MKHYFFITAVLITLLSNAVAYAGKFEHVFCGGPSGGTFMYYANAISNLMKSSEISITSIATKGSIDNIRTVNSGAAEFGIAYTEDVIDGMSGKLLGDNYKYKDTRIVGFLYSAPVQIIVKKDSGIYSLQDLRGKKVAVGGIGSGSAANAERILSSVGVWNNITKYYIGYRNALGALNNNLIDALWLYSGVPNATVAEAAENGNVRLLDLSREIDTGKLTVRFPFFTTYIIPSDTYKSFNKSIYTLSGSAIWITNKKVSDEDVYKMMSKVYSVEGIKFMKSQHNSAKNMMSKDMIQHIDIPMHPAALKFWKQKGFIN